MYNANLMNAYKDRHVAWQHLDSARLNGFGQDRIPAPVCWFHDGSTVPGHQNCPRIWKNNAFFRPCHPTASHLRPQMTQNKLEDRETTGLHQSLQGFEDVKM